MSETAFAKRRCVPCEGGVPPLDPETIAKHKQQLDTRWSVENGKQLVAKFEFKNYWQTTAFVNAVAYIAHQQDHHPDIEFGYKQCTVRYWTHASGGLTENDFICAARIDQLLI